MPTAETTSLTTLDPETGDEFEWDVPTKLNGWVYDPDAPRTRGSIVWVDPGNEGRYVFIDRQTGHSFITGLRGPEEHINYQNSTQENAIEDARTLMSTHRSEGGGNPTEADDTDDVEGGHIVAPALFDGSIRFMPEFTKDEAEYVAFDAPAFDETHDRCGECVHFIEGGGCHLVQDEIDPRAYCEEFYADYGAFGHAHEDRVEVNAELVSPSWDYDDAAIRDFVDEIEERLQQRAREHNPSDDGGY